MFPQSPIEKADKKFVPEPDGQYIAACYKVQTVLADEAGELRLKIKFGFELVYVFANDEWSILQNKSYTDKTTGATTYSRPSSTITMRQFMSAPGPKASHLRKLCDLMKVEAKEGVFNLNTIIGKWYLLNLTTNESNYQETLVAGPASPAAYGFQRFPDQLNRKLYMVFDRHIPFQDHAEAGFLSLSEWERKKYTSDKHWEAAQGKYGCPKVTFRPDGQLLFQYTTNVISPGRGDETRLGDRWQQTAIKGVALTAMPLTDIDDAIAKALTHMQANNLGEDSNAGKILMHLYLAKDNLLETNDEIPF
ncbi:MAG: hypothetical protein ACRCWR_04110 [Saezia sp.]